eukprot:PhF_6_TR41266/c1_g2_i5/m.62372/K07874/RAB1A; Ras-related protein Rab-1A
MSVLPIDVLCGVFGYLDLYDVPNAASTNQRWLHACQDSRHLSSRVEALKLVSWVRSLQPIQPGTLRNPCEIASITKPSLPSPSLIGFDNPVIVKAMLFGSNRGCGLSTLMETLAESKPLEKAPPSTIGMDFKIKTVDWVRYQLWDCPFERRRTTFRGSILRNVTVMLWVYDVTQPDPFNTIENYVREIERPGMLSRAPYAVLVGTKYDTLNRDDGSSWSHCMDVSFAADRFAQFLNIPHVRCSCKTMEGLDTLESY